MDKSKRHHVVADAFVGHVPFCKQLGIKVHQATRDTVVLSYEKQHEHVGNYMIDVLHGGVIATLLDTVGAANCLVDAVDDDMDLAQIMQDERLAKSATIDLRVDYLRPGMGQHFLAHSRLMRRGNRVAVTRMDLYNESETMIAVGTGTYLIGS